jgi:hypothetical protein
MWLIDFEPVVSQNLLVARKKREAVRKRMHSGIPFRDIPPVTLLHSTSKGSTFSYYFLRLVTKLLEH